MNKKGIVIISSLCLLLGNNTSLAGDRTEREMLSIAATQFAKGGKTRSAQNIEKLADESTYAVYGNNEQGFVIVSRDDNFTPVLAYSDTKFDAANLPAGMQWWLGAITARMESGAQRAYTRTVDYTPTEALCATKWGQGDPYNFLAPLFNGEHAPSGCVATAMSQIMKYFAYPAQGKGDGYYTIDGSTSRVNEKIEGVYQWDKMLNTYETYNLTDEQRMPVARLMKDAALATHMDYGASGSGSYSVIASRGFAYNFAYDSLALHCYYRDFFSNEMWMNTIYSELSSGRPILYTGAGASGGHAFVFDGFDANGNIHVNWGWDGVCNGYYDIADLTPIDQAGSKNYGVYNSDQSMVFGFKCQETPDENETYASLWCTDTNKRYTLGLEGKILEVQSPAIYNFHFLWFWGKLGANFENLDGDSSKDTFIKIGQDQNEIPTFRGTQDINNSVFITKVKPGKYKVYLASWAINEEKCQPIRCLGGAPYYEITITEDGKTSISEQKWMDDTSSTTGISSVKTNNGTNATKSATIYTLDGRNMGTNPSALPKGIYIINGRKVIK
jgi:hypothetical protein